MSAFTQIISASTDDIKDKLPLYVKYLALPFVALILLENFGDILFVSLENIELESATKDSQAVTLNIEDMINIAIAFILYIYFELNLAFIAHKITLDKQSEISIVDGLVWRKKHLPFIKAFLLLTLILFSMIVPLIIVLTKSEFSSSFVGLILNLILIFIGSLLILYIFSRYSLIVPAAAANKPLKLTESFSLTKGYGWIIAILTIIIPAVFQSMIDAAPPSFLSGILVNLSLIFSFILLTNTYKYINNKEAHPPSFATDRKTPKTGGGSSIDL